MHIFRYVQVNDDSEGVLVDMTYEMENGYEKIINLTTRMVVEGKVTKQVPCDPVMKIAFATSILQILEKDRQMKNNNLNTEE